MLAQGGLISKFEVSLKRFPNDPKNKLFLTCNVLIQHPQILYSISNSFSFFLFTFVSPSWPAAVSGAASNRDLIVCKHLLITPSEMIQKGWNWYIHFELQILSYFIDLKKKKCDYPILVSVLNWHKRLIDLVRNWNGTDLYFQITSGCEE
jgi:hypothetical protein